MNIKSIIKEIKRENLHEEKRIKHRIKSAFEEVEVLKRDFLKIDKQMEKMILFGSLAENKVEAIDFDIDIAVKSNKHYRLVGRALNSQFNVDVVDLDSVHKNILENIMKNGIVLYEKK